MKEMSEVSLQMVARELHRLSAARLFGPGEWLADRETCSSLNARLAELGLQAQVDDLTTKETAVGRALSLDLHLIFMGLMCEFEVPWTLEDHQLLDADEVERLYDRLGRSDNPSTLLRPFVQRAYRAHFGQGRFLV